MRTTAAGRIVFTSTPEPSVTSIADEHSIARIGKASEKRQRITASEPKVA
jgi:hypothetical protein